MRRRIVILVVLALIAGILGFSIAKEFRNGCEERLISSSISPDHNWTAELYETQCGSGAWASSLITDLRLRSVQSGTVTDILAKDTHGLDENRPIITWEGNNVLDVRLRDYHSLDVLTHSVQGVTIRLGT